MDVSGGDQPTRTQSARKMENPTNVAREVHKALKEVGFEEEKVRERSIFRNKTKMRDSPEKMVNQENLGGREKREVRLTDILREC